MSESAPQFTHQAQPVYQPLPNAPQAPHAHNFSIVTKKTKAETWAKYALWASYVMIFVGALNVACNLLAFMTMSNIDIPVPIDHNRTATLRIGESQLGWMFIFKIVSSALIFA
jgi:hypothetical protein